MIDKRTVEFLEKMAEAKKLELDAILLLLPNRTKEHLDVIGKEVKSIFMEYIQEVMKDDNVNSETSNSNVRKVDIC
ncbi:MAG: hypothetical protein AB7V48_00930 [Sedimentibacter sp.]